MAAPARDTSDVPGQQTSPPRVVVIIGSGRSGSTLLDIVIGGHPDVEGVGAFQKLARSGWTPDDARRCSCGTPIDRCPFWSDVLERWRIEVGSDAVHRYIELQDRFERTNWSWPKLALAKRRPSSAFAAYGAMTAALYRSVLDASGRDVVLDSSKKPLRAYALVATGALDVRVIHLVRDGRGVVWSRSKHLGRDIEGGVPKPQPPTPPWRTSLHWTQANLESEWVARCVGPERAIRVTYEELVGNPVDTLTRLSSVVGEDLRDPAIALVRGEPMRAAHRVAGNRMRLGGAIRIQPDLEWTTALPHGDERTFWLLGGWLAARYGYQR